jgi:hypothetical protein
MTRTLLAILHVLGAALFVVFMIARTAQAVDDAQGQAQTTPARHATTTELNP